VFLFENSKGKLLDKQVVVSKGKTLKIWGVLNQWKTLQCIMYSRPSPNFQWKNKNTGAEIRNTPDLFKIEETDGISNLTVSELIISGFDPFSKAVNIILKTL